MHEWCYVYAGLRVISCLELPEWEHFLSDERFEHPDVWISVATTEENGLSTLSTEPVISADKYHFFIPDVGAYRVVNGNEIVVYPVASAGKNELRLFLLGSAWGALCYQRGLFAVHASAVCVDSEAVIFCAFQGMGKSTMTAYLAAQGYPLVSDDLCCIDMQTQSRPNVYPSAQRFRLWQDALGALGWDNNQLERDHFRFDKFLLPWTGESMTRPVPLRAIYLLEWGENSLVRMSGMNALQRFVAAATYRGELLEKMGLSASYWQRCLELLQAVPVWELTRPKNITIMADTVTLLEKHWAAGSEK